MRILSVYFIGLVLVTLCGCAPGTYSFYPRGNNPCQQNCPRNSCAYYNYSPQTNINKYYPVVGF